jgi:hypothetical protein
VNRFRVIREIIKNKMSKTVRDSAGQFKTGGHSVFNS